MAAFLAFWLPIGALFVSWEAALANPSRIAAWFGLCLVAAGFIAWRFASGVTDRLALLLVPVGVFWWGLWLDFSLLKFVLPAFALGAFVYVIAPLRRDSPGDAAAETWLALFLGGSFFWSSISYGLVTVLGRSLWESLMVFLAAFGIFAWSATARSRLGAPVSMPLYAIFLLFAAEVFSILVWLPFTEVTLGLLTTVALLFFYDMAKYMADPELIRKKIILKKIAVYAAFVLLVLFSTPWQ